MRRSAPDADEPTRFNRSRKTSAVSLPCSSARVSSSRAFSMSPALYADTPLWRDSSDSRWALGQRTARTLNVRACPVVMALQEYDTRPDADRTLVLAGEIVIEPREQELLDSRLAVGVVWQFRGTNRIGRQRIGHRLVERLRPIIGQNPSWVNQLQRFALPLPLDF